LQPLAILHDIRTHPTMRLKHAALLALLFTMTGSAFCQVAVYPPNWWTGMKRKDIQLVVRTADATFNQSQVKINYPGITVKKVSTVENPKYLIVDLTIEPTAASGTASIEFTKGKKTQRVPWPLKAREPGKNYAQGVTSSDFIYLLMPDRFSNGDPTNDKVKGMLDQSLNRDSIFDRHGGDLQGIINHLDYLQELGVTTLWMTPVLETNMKNRTEHGYAITDHYKVDPRFGGDALYKKLSDELHRRNMKLIQDGVYNHVGFQHWIVQDSPAKDWLHQWPTYTGTTYKDQTLFDPYASTRDKTLMSDGWFTRMMPDLNHQNPYVVNFLIQHAIWSVEEFGVDGWRVDTYIYNDLEFMNQCNQALYDEYPKMTIFGETWVHGVINQAYFTRHKMDTPFKSNLQGVTDFQLNMYGIEKAVNEPFGWTNGVNRLYQTLSNDFVYQDPMANVIFLDNHDLSRFFSVVGEDVAKQKMGLTWLLTCRGIPQMYYGTEILMKGFTNPDGWVRLDFAGGWAGDKSNKFTSAGRTKEEEEVFQLTKKLGQFRLKSSALKTGKLTHFFPENGVYVYFRHDASQTVMCIMNTNEQESTVGLERFSEILKSFRSGNEVTTGSTIALEKEIKVPGRYVMVLELK
jgi:neopullulanase